MDYMVKMRTMNGWQVIKCTDGPAEADKWLTEYIRTNGYSCGDFTIVCK